VLDTGAVTRGSGSKNEDKERNIRKWFVDRGFIDSVILLPDNLFYNTNAAGARRKRRTTILVPVGGLAALPKRTGTISPG
jgi:hypothetical protein